MRLLLLVALLLGCKEKAAPPAAGVTEPAVRTFAATLTTEMPRCDEDRLAAKIDGAALAARMKHPATANPAGDAAHQICAWMQGIHSYRHVGVRTIDKQRVAIMRRLFADPATAKLRVNYDRVLVGRRGNDVALVDLYSYRQGLWISEVLANKTPSPDVLQARELIAAGKQDDAMALIDKLPVGVRRDLMLRAFLQAQLLPDPQKRQARDELAKAFPNDPAIALTMIDAGFALGDFDSVQHWCDVLFKEIGADTYLDMIRAIAFLQQGKLELAYTWVSDGLAAEPTLTQAHEVKLDILIAQKKWPEVLAEMTELENNHNMRFEEAKLRAEPRLADLVTTPEFTAWLASRDSAPPPPADSTSAPAP
jgi:hypothetical protein